MNICTEWRARVWSGLTVCLALGLVAALGSTQKAPAKKSLRVHIVQWGKDAQLSRKLTKADIEKIKKTRKKGDNRPIPAYSAVIGVKAGQSLQVPDIVETKTQEVAILGGELTYTRLKPNSRLKYVTIKPTEFVRSKPANLHVSIEKGKGQFRVGTLARSSLIKAVSPIVATGAKGTAYSIAVQGQETTLIVAEGKVDIYRVSAPGTAVTVNPREKFVYSVGDPFPRQAVPIAESDEKEIRELLSLPTQNLFGYVGERELRRPDAEDIVTLNVRPAFRILTGTDASQRPKRRSSVYPNMSSFRYVDEAGGEKTHDGEFLGASKDGKVWVVYRSGQGTLAMSPTGKVLSTLAVGKLRSVQVAPNGSRIVAYGEEPGQKGMILSYRVAGGPPTRVEGPMGSSPEFQVIWRRGGARYFIVQKIQGKNVVYNPAASANAIQPYFDADPFEISPGGDWLMSISGPNRYYFTPLDTGQAAPPALAVSSETKPLFLGAGTGPNDTESIAYTPLGTGQLYKKGPADVGQGTPFEFPRGVASETYHSSALSPNSELVTFLNTTTKTAYVADSADLSRDSDTYVGIKPPSEWEWVSGNEVWYEDMLEGVKDSIIITLGVKRQGALPGGTGAQSGSPSRPLSGTYPGIKISSIQVPRRTGSQTREPQSGRSGVVEISPGLYRPKLVLANNQVGATESFEQMIKRTGAVAAINGGFFDAYSDQPFKRPYNMLVTNSQVVNRSNLGSIAGFDENGKLSILRVSDLKGQGRSGDGAPANFVEGVGGGPTLVRNGEVVVDPEAEGHRDPSITRDYGARSCIGVKKDGTILLVATSGTIRQAAQQMKDLGCVDAMNLDGGASSAVFGAGKYVRPAGRPLSTALVFVHRR